MGKPKKPREGSLAYYPRKRASRIYPRVTTFPAVEKPTVLGFAGYKAGMVRTILIDSVKSSKTFGQEIAKAATVLDCPPLRVVGMRSYSMDSRGLVVFADAWTDEKEIPKDLERKMEIKGMKKDGMKVIENGTDKISRLRLFVCTQPRASGVSKKKPEFFELEVGGKDTKAKIDFAKQLLGKDIAVSDVIKTGELIDVIAVTKGKGTAGVVKRWGVKIQNRHAKKKRRHIGSLGPQVPRRVRWFAPQAGQLGFQTRTEMNKRVLKIGDKGEEITPVAGFKRYGVVKSNYMLVEGSVPGSKKRLIYLRLPMRPSKIKMIVPEIKEVMRE
jgi:large subunit ribosomal protein L3